MPGRSLIVPDGVEGERGAGDDGAAGLGGEARRFGDAGLAAGLSDGGGPLFYGGRLLALDVGDAEAAADAQLGELERVEEAGEGLDLLDEGVEQEDLAADVGVDADELDCPAVVGGEALDCLCGLAGAEAEAELGVLLSGHDVLVGVGLDAGRDPDEHAWPCSPGVRGGRSRRRSRPRCGPRPLVMLVGARPRTCCCRGGSGGRQARPRPGRRGARRRSTRRCTCPPRRRGRPWPCRGRPSRRRRRRRPMLGGRRGSAGGGAPRRR